MTTTIGFCADAWNSKEIFACGKLFFPKLIFILHIRPTSFLMTNDSIFFKATDHSFQFFDLNLEV